MGLISSNYRLSIQGSIAANLAGKLGNSHWAAVSVADSAANIVKNLDALQAHTANISGISLTDTGTPNLKLTVASVSSDLSVLNNIQSNYLLSVNDSASTINKLDLSGLHTSSIELLPTNLIVGGTVQENTQVTNLNLSLINLNGDSINEKVYNTTGTEIDILDSTSAIISQFIFTHDTEAQLHLVGVGSTPIHLI